MPKQTGLEKMSEKMFGGGVTVARPVGDGERVSAERRREILAAAVAEGRVQQVPEEVVPVVPEAPAAEEERRRPGRPKREPVELKPMNFRVSADFHRKVRLLAADCGKNATELLYEAFGDLFVKYGVKD